MKAEALDDPPSIPESEKVSKKGVSITFSDLQSPALPHNVCHPMYSYVSIVIHSPHMCWHHFPA